MAHFSRRDSASQNSRPTLPPIRDLFRDELSRHPETLHDPSLTLARLRVSDDDGYASSSSKGSSRHTPNQQIYGLPGPPRYSDRPIYSQHNVSYRDPNSHAPPSRSEYPASLTASHSHGHVARGSPYPSSAAYPPVNSHSSGALRSLSHSYGHGHSLAFPAKNYDNPSQYSQEPSSYYTGVPAISRHRSETSSTDNRSPQLAWNLSTSVSRHVAEADEQTPVGRYHNSEAYLRPVDIPHADPHQLLDDGAGGAASKYECPYCGKGFNRPSSLKIHLNSHTGEKPFVCPVASCGRSFSVLSNMRRHARVHNAPGEHDMKNSDSPTPSSSNPQPVGYASPGKWQHRGRSNSTSSSNASYDISRRSRSISSNDNCE